MHFEVINLHFAAYSHTQRGLKTHNNSHMERKNTEENYGKNELEKKQFFFSFLETETTSSRVMLEDR